MADLTEITHKVTVGGRETTILAEFQKQVGGQPTTTPTLRAYTARWPRIIVRHVPCDHWNPGGETATFEISEATFKYLRGVP